MYTVLRNFSGAGARIVLAAILGGSLVTATLTNAGAGGKDAKLIVSKQKPITKSSGLVAAAGMFPRARPSNGLLPSPRPADVAYGLAALEPAAEPEHPFGLEPAPQLKRVLDEISADRYGEARRMMRGLDDSFDVKIAEWLLARAPASGLSAKAIVKIMDSHVNWPEPELLLLRAEIAFLGTGPSTKSVLAFFARNDPMTTSGRIELAEALKKSGSRKEAADLIERIWRQDSLTSARAARFIDEHNDVLTRDDHQARFDRLVYARNTPDAVEQGKRLGPGRDKLARAAIAAFGRNTDGADKQLAKVPLSLRGEPTYKLARARLLRRSGKLVSAARIMQAIAGDPRLEIDQKRWWDERRDLARQLLDDGYPALAYQVAAGHSARTEKDVAEAEFHAGWFALRYLDHPHLARRHFEGILAVATLPRTLARAHYWIGRAQEAAGETDEARGSYEIAGRFGTNFYGQLAREKLGLTTTGLETLADPTASDRMRFADNESVRVIKRLAAAGHRQRTLPFFRHIAQSSERPGEVGLAMLLARRLGQERMALTVAKQADRPDLAIGGNSAPFLGVPSSVSVPEGLPRALVYAIAKQESAFNAAAVSHAGARGLMQLMPATAKATARNAGLPYSLPRLTRDPYYNASLGAAHLGELMGNLRGSYILTFVGYNAGPGRAIQWVKAYGDPRAGRTDPVDWIERIPFDETRDYVQKVMENLQAYKSRLGYPLAISADLVRGRPAG